MTWNLRTISSQAWTVGVTVTPNWSLTLELYRLLALKLPGERWAILATTRRNCEHSREISGSGGNSPRTPPLTELASDSRTEMLQYSEVFLQAVRDLVRSQASSFQAGCHGIGRCSQHVYGCTAGCSWAAYCERVHL